MTRGFAVAIAVLALLPLLLAAPARGAELPPGFDDARVAALPAPTALAFLPDGAILVATQGGQLRLVRDGVLREAPVLDLKPAVTAGRPSPAGCATRSGWPSTPTRRGRAS